MAKLLIKEICKEKGISQKELAEKMGISASALSQSIKSPSIPTLERIASCLGVHLTDLFENDTIRLGGCVLINNEVFPVKDVTDIEKALERYRLLSDTNRTEED